MEDIQPVELFLVGSVSGSMQRELDLYRVNRENVLVWPPVSVEAAVLPKAFS